MLFRSDVMSTDAATQKTGPGAKNSRVRRIRSQSSSDSLSMSDERVGAGDVDLFGEYEEDDFSVEDSSQERVIVKTELNQDDFISKFSEKYFSVPALNGSCGPDTMSSRSVIVNGFRSHDESTSAPDLQACENVDQRQFLNQFSQKYFEVSKTGSKLAKPGKKTLASPCYNLRDMEVSFWRVFHIVIDKTKDCYACSEDGNSEYSTEDDESSDSNSDSSNDDASSSDSESKKRRTRSARKAKRAVNIYYKLFYGDKPENSKRDGDAEDSPGEEEAVSESESSSTEESSLSLETKSDPSSETEEFLIQSGVYSIGKAYTDPHHGPLTMELKLIGATPTDTVAAPFVDGLNPKFDKFYIHGMNFNHLNALTRSNSMYSRSASFSFSSLHRSNSAKFNSLSRSASTTYSAAFVFASVSDDQRGAPEHVSVIQIGRAHV